MNPVLSQRNVRGKQVASELGQEQSDEELLERFLSGPESESQDAFRVLVARHGPMVLGVCRHVLNQHHDAEDAFQATFLALARKGRTIRDPRVLAGWLHEVAFRMAVKARASAIQRRSLEREGMSKLPAPITPDTQDQVAAWNELRPVLHAEVERLPDRYRIPVILSYLEGKTNEEVAELLAWPVGTVKGRLSRARELLRSRLVRRGLSLSAAFLLTSLRKGVTFAEIVPMATIERTTAAASRAASNEHVLLRGDSTRRSAIPVAQADTPAVAPGGRVRRIVSRGLFVLVFSIISFRATIGISRAVFEPGEFWTFNKVVSAFNVAIGVDIDAPCH